MNRQQDESEWRGVRVIPKFSWSISNSFFYFGYLSFLVPPRQPGWRFNIHTFTIRHKMVYKHNSLLKELYKKIKRPTYSSLAVIKINNWMIQLYTKDTCVGGKVHLKSNCKIWQEFEFFFKGLEIWCQILFYLWTLHCPKSNVLIRPQSCLHSHIQ